jgi:cytochrome c peroxidase
MLRLTARRAGVALGLLAGCAPPTLELDADQAGFLDAMSPVPPPPPDTTNAWADDPAAAWLGQWLFYDVGLSQSGETSCASCHSPDQGFSDERRLSEEAGVTARHAQHVRNSAHGWFLFWDGRCDSQWCQALGPIEDDSEMAFTRLQVAHRIAGDPQLAVAYEGIFGGLPDLADGARFPAEGRPRPNDPTHPDHVAWQSMAADDQAAVNTLYAHVGKAIAAYERLLVSRDAPLDAFVEAWRDDDSAGMEVLSAEAQRGAELFTGDAGCVLCHFGPTLSSGQFANVGLAQRDWLQVGDPGRFGGIETLLASEWNGAGAYSDDPDGQGQERIGFLAIDDSRLGQFKVPGLRDVALSAPYMHGGHFDTLLQVVTHYDELTEVPPLGHREEELIPLGLDDEERLALVAFLQSLTGAAPDPSLIGAPESPIPPSR